MKKILHLCADTGSDSKPYKDAGYDVQLVGSDIGIENYHPPTDVYGIIANPPCTKFSRAAHQIKKKDRDFAEGMRLVKECLRVIWEIQENGAPLKFWVIENPDGYLTQFLGYPHFSYQPWQFGETGVLATKRTMLWGYFNKPKPTTIFRNIPPKLKQSDFKKVMANSLFEPPVARGGDIEWSKMSMEERSQCSPYFANAFFKANQ